MKCKKCNAEWNVSATVSASLTECPFCKASFTEPKDKLVFDNLHDALAAIYADERYGLDVLLGDRCHLYITDYYPGIKTLMKARVKLVSTSGAAGFLKAAANSSKAEKERAILLAIQKLTDEGDGKDTATDIIYEYVSVLNWGVKKTQSAPKAKTSSAPAPQPRPSPARVIPEAVAEIRDGKRNGIKFGIYEGKPILWRVLDVNGDSALLLTEDIIEKRRYHSLAEATTWADCELRAYLNGTGSFYGRGFIDKVFNPEEKALIMPAYNTNLGNPWNGTPGGQPTTDRLFLLSIEDVVIAFGDSGKLKNKKYQHWTIWDQYSSDRISTYESEVWWWWLRSPGYSRSSAADIHNSGEIDVAGLSVRLVEGGVRPALLLNLKSFDPLLLWKNLI